MTRSSSDSFQSVGQLTWEPAVRSSYCSMAASAWASAAHTASTVGSAAIRLGEIRRERRGVLVLEGVGHGGHPGGRHLDRRQARVRGVHQAEPGVGRSAAARRTRPGRCAAISRSERPSGAGSARCFRGLRPCRSPTRSQPSKLPVGQGPVERHGADLVQVPGRVLLGPGVEEQPPRPRPAQRRFVDRADRGDRVVEADRGGRRPPRPPPRRRRLGAARTSPAAGRSRTSPCAAARSSAGRAPRRCPSGR